MFKLLFLLVAVTAVWGLPSGGRFPLKKSGRLIPGGRIVGGHDADLADYPYQLILTWFGFLNCGASMLGPKWALTAASCTDLDFPEYFEVVAGDWIRGGQVVQITAIHRHPQYDNYTTDYDIAVLELAEEITIEDASPIALHDAGFVVEEGTAVTITGWGNTGAGNPDVLQVLVTKVVSNEVCNESYRGEVTDRMMCAGNFEEGGEGACYGDGGGPLVVDGKQYGVASWGASCAKPHYPGVNARVTEESIREFIADITGL